MLKSPRYHNWNFLERNNNSLKESSELRAAAETRLELDLKTELTTRQLGGLVEEGRRGMMLWLLLSLHERFP